MTTQQLHPFALGAHQAPSVRTRSAPFRATAAFSISFALASLLLAWMRIQVLQRFDARWPAELHWALEAVSWPFVALLVAIIFSLAVTFSRYCRDQWGIAAAFGVGLALLIAAPSILGARVDPPLASWLTWVLVLIVPVIAAGSLREASTRVAVD